MPNSLRSKSPRITDTPLRYSIGLDNICGWGAIFFLAKIPLEIIALDQRDDADSACRFAWAGCFDEDYRPDQVF